jgi:hypothetical protein
MIIDFKEIPPANSSDGDQDIFELFARDFVAALGLKVLEQPGRGQDGGKDLLLVENLSGIRQSAKRHWLLSAKHFAVSGRSVGVSDEVNIRDRVERIQADGFLGFYSTLPSSGLIDTFKGLGERIAVDHLDRGSIEQYLISDPTLNSVFKTYFPQSYGRFLSVGGYPAATKDMCTMFLGGDAYPHLEYGINRDGVIAPMICNDGVFTLYDLDVIISYSPGRGGAYIRRDRFPFLHPGSNDFCHSFHIREVEKEGYIYSKVYARNGAFFQVTQLLEYVSEDGTERVYHAGSMQIHREQHNSRNRELILNKQGVKMFWTKDKKFHRAET